MGICTGWRTNRKSVPDFKKQDVKPYPATRFFDQMSFIGDEIVGCFLLETSSGLILLDCMNPDEWSINMIEDGIKNLGLSCQDLNTILISHGHGDHFGRADYFQMKYGTKICMSRVDFEFASNLPERAPWKSINFPVDHFYEDMEFYTLGDMSIQCISTPGHSPGCYSFIIPVTDEGRMHTMALWGGSGILPDTDKSLYLKSLGKFSAICQASNVDGEIATHPCLDNGLLRLDIIRNIVDGVPNPFILGNEGYRYYEQMFFDMVADN